MSSHAGPSQWHRMNNMRDDSFLRTRTNSVDTGVDVADKDEAMEEKMAAFRDRFHASEKYIDRIFSSDRPCCKADGLDLDILEHDDDDAGGFGGGLQSSVQAPPAPPTRRIVEDDYDDEDEDDEPTPTKPKMAPTPTPTKAQNLLDVPKTQHHTEAKKSPAATREKLEADRKAAEQAAKSALSTMFFTLENDRDAMLEQQKLEESDRQVHAENSAQGENGNATGKLSAANLGASSLTLKHLIKRIDVQRHMIQMSDIELRNLISEVRKNRSKWASEDKVGQEELYEAAEKVTIELRAYTEHSTAFLNRVNKREVPDYFTVIKTPMDLGTVLKKLKQLAYKSKAEFVADLNLIWQNCFTYNGDPNHYLRKHAKAMQKKMLEMIPLIPDITIRDRAEVEAEEAGAAEIDADAESDDEPIMSTRGRKGPGSKKAKKARGTPTRVEGTPEVKPLTVNLLRAESVPPGGDAGSQNGFGTPGPGGGGTPAPANGISQMDLDHADKIDDDTADAEYQAWKTMTKRGRALITSERHKLFKGDRLQPDEPALLRTREGMGRFLRSGARHFHQHDEERLPSDNSPHSTDNLVEDGTEAPLIPDYYDSLSTVPELPWNIEWRPGEEVDIMTELKMGEKDIWKAPKNGLVNKMNSNMKQMQETRKICSKISVVKQMQTQTQIYANQFSKYNPEEFVEKDVEDYVVSQDGPVFSQTLCRAALQRSIGKIFYHTGFEEFQPTAIEAVTDIAADYFQKLARTVMLYKESPAGFSNQEIILHSLHENGVDLDAVESYIKDDIHRLGFRLDTIHERMKTHLTDLLRPAFQDTSGDGSALFNDGSEQFVGGDFAEDIGDDFFGFKELGLDKEFGLDSLTVPLHLLQARIRNPAESQIHAAANPDGYKPPPPFEPLTHDILHKQIHVVKNFYLAKLHANNEEPLVEDEDLPIKQRAPKPRLPPTGKISVPRKRPQHQQGGGSKKKKKPNPPPQEAESQQSAKKKGGTAMARTMSKMSDGDGDNNGGMISPESLVAGS
ncbi:hypothetical protein DFH27DRAFT_570801 [Peziza echinospora]|nr:hypothetical protein DFH27DRAFT_570801 [Peziza echinospora]